MRSRFWLLAAVVVLLDQWTKHLVERYLPLDGAPVPLVPGAVWLAHVHNPGMAFGQLRGAGPLLIVAAVAAVACIVLYRARLLHRGEPLHPLLVLGLSLPLGGAVGNMLDRIRLGKVVDFISLGWFPVFNVADSAITVGAVALVVYFLFLCPAPQSHPEVRTSPREPGQEQA